jgi:hypothetical protein
MTSKESTFFLNETMVLGIPWWVAIICTSTTTYSLWPKKTAYVKGSRQQTEDRRQQTAGNRQQTADKGQQMADGRWQTADGRRQTADGRRQTTDKIE